MRIEILTQKKINISKTKKIKKAKKNGIEIKKANKDDCCGDFCCIKDWCVSCLGGCTVCCCAAFNTLIIYGTNFLFGIGIVCALITFMVLPMFIICFILSIILYFICCHFDQDTSRANVCEHNCCLICNDIFMGLGLPLPVLKKNAAKHKSVEREVELQTKQSDAVNIAVETMFDPRGNDKIGCFSACCFGTPFLVNCPLCFMVMLYSGVGERPTMPEGRRLNNFLALFSPFTILILIYLAQLGCAWIGYFATLNFKLYTSMVYFAEFVGSYRTMIANIINVITNLDEWTQLWEYIINVTFTWEGIAELFTIFWFQSFKFKFFSLRTFLAVLIELVNSWNQDIF